MVLITCGHRLAAGRPGIEAKVGCVRPKHPPAPGPSSTDGKWRSGYSRAMVTSDVASTTVVFLHPGAMGSRVAGECRAKRRLWVGDGRSAETRRRAEDEGLGEVATLASALDQADVAISICPPAEALSVARTVAETGFAGIYVDANAVAPGTVARMAHHFAPARLVDGGIIGPPPTAPGTTRLYLSSESTAAAETVARLWQESNLDARLVAGGPGAASALKMAYAAWTKGSAALLSAVVAGASAMGVRQDLESEWAISQPGLLDRARGGARSTGRKAWRFTGEMNEIAEAFNDVAVPHHFWLAAAETYRRMAPLKDAASPDLDAVVSHILESPSGGEA